MLDAAKAKDLATRWLQAANTHNVDAILSFYAEDAVLESPVVVKMLNEPSGAIRGLPALRDYFTKGVATYPHMSMQLIESAYGVSSITAWYVNHRGTRTSAYLELGADGKITRNVTHYNV
ncbi:MAG TPA: nuclear transport factor 2 family protein [Candidatus Binatia bacterium]|nr:nuclear transport factor 2 family protein [Candidatus Binatia bacterium]